MICIGPGTGIAPMRSLLYHHFSNSLEQSCLIFGSRSKEKDYFYAQEWTDAIEKYPFKPITAFSRDQDQKIYVQHRIIEHGEFIWNLVRSGAVIYLSGYLLINK
jgi:sulfite reductase alpha subunit-like flavoprotein